MKEIVEYLKSIGYKENNPFGHKIPDIIEMIRGCKNPDAQGLFYDSEFFKLKSMVDSYDISLRDELIERTIGLSQDDLNKVLEFINNTKK